MFEKWLKKYNNIIIDIYKVYEKGMQFNKID